MVNTKITTEEKYNTSAVVSFKALKSNGAPVTASEDDFAVVWYNEEALSSVADTGIVDSNKKYNVKTGEGSMTIATSNSSNPGDFFGTIKFKSSVAKLTPIKVTVKRVDNDLDPAHSSITVNNPVIYIPE